MVGPYLGGHNIQAHVGSGTRYHGPPDDIDLWLSSGWWVSFRNQFAQAPEVAAKIITSVDDELSKITAELEHSRGPQMMEAQDQLWATTFRARGPDFWR